MSKQGAVLYSKIRNGGYGCQFTGTYSESPSGNRHCGAGNYSTRISSGKYNYNYSVSGTDYVSYKKPNKKKKLSKADRAKILKKKQAKINKSKNPWFTSLSLNKVSEQSVKYEVDSLCRAGDVETIEKFYSPDFKVKSINIFELQLWVLKNLAIIPKRDIVLKEIRLINLVNCGTKPIFVGEKRIFENKTSIVFNPFTVQSGEHAILELKKDVCYQIGIDQTVLFEIKKK